MAKKGKTIKIKAVKVKPGGDKKPAPVKVKLEGRFQAVAKIRGN